MPDQEDFLRDVANGLPFGETERGEILEELRAHVIDSTAELEAEGRSPDDARRTAVERLGPPDRLAKDLTDARRSRRRLLAAAGAGSWALVTSGFYGYLVGVLLSALAFISVLVAAQVMGPWIGWTGLGTSSQRFDPVSFIGMGVALYVAGSAITPVVAARAGYPVDRVRRVLAPIGVLLLTAYALAGWSGPLDLVGVVTLLTLPAWWALGTWRMSPVGRGSARTFAGLFLIAFAAIVLSQFVQARLRDAAIGAAGEPTATGDWGLSRIGAPTPPAIADVITGQGSTSVEGSAGTAALAFQLDVVDATRFAGWTDLRVEAWQALDPGPGSPNPVISTAVGPFAVAPAAWSPPGELPGGGLTWSSDQPWGPEAMTLSGAVQLDRTPEVTAAWVSMTGVAPDGTRHVIGEPDYVETGFSGTVLDWLSAVAAPTGN